jgi:ubiquinone/menaquinone biosynthesis C-methylase UbiE
MGDWTFVKVEPSGSLPFKGNCFDFVFHQDVIEHTEMPYGFLNEQYRVLRKGGNILVGTSNLFGRPTYSNLLWGEIEISHKDDRFQ